MINFNELVRNPLSPQDDYCQYHPRVWNSDGWIVDLGCYGWNWSQPFIGKKKVLGVDPVEKTIPEGALLFEGFVGSITGKIDYDFKEDIHSISGHSVGMKQSEIYSLDFLLDAYNINKVDILKMNVEGMEHDILINLKSPIADQIIVAFHYSEEATSAIIQYLRQWYDWCIIDKQWRWYLFLRRG